jgi:hypothetical protein
MLGPGGSQGFRNFRFYPGTRIFLSAIPLQQLLLTLCASGIR